MEKGQGTAKLNRGREIQTEVRIVKILHVLMMVIFPVIVGVTPLILGVATVYHTTAQKGFLFGSTLATLFYCLWIMYTYFMLTVIRNYYLQQIVTEDCNFAAYLECMKFLEKFYIQKKASFAQQVNRTDAYLLMGDFDGAYQNLMKLRGFYEKFSMRGKEMYDYFWCRFYAELEDANNFQICVEKFKRNWTGDNENLRPAVKAQAEALVQELEFRNMLFTRRNDAAKSILVDLYRNGKIGTRYEFFKYCYFMGKVEFSMANYSIAKHWFAQTVSFGLKEHMTKRAEALLQKLDEMQVSYAVLPPQFNTMNIRRRTFNLFSAIFSIVMGLLLIIVFMIS